MSKKKKERKFRKKQDNLQKEYLGISISEYGHTDMVFYDMIFRQCRFSTLRLKNCKVEDCQITQCIIDEDSYLRHALFRNVDFTGTIFRNCNLEKAQFIDCNLDYVKFENCILNCESIIMQSMPKETNLKLALCRQLYNNELGQGRIDVANNLLKMVRENERAMYWDILCAKSEYFRKQRKGQIRKYICKYVGCTVDKYVWGYGLSIGRIGLSILICIIVFALTYSYSIAWGETDLFEKLTSSILFSINSILMGGMEIIAEQKLNLLTKIIVLLQNTVGMIYLALLTSALYRKVAR